MIYAIKSVEKVAEYPSAAGERFSMFPLVTCPGGGFGLVLNRKVNRTAGETMSCGLGGGCCELDRFTTTAEIKINDFNAQ